MLIALTVTREGAGSEIFFGKSQEFKKSGSSIKRLCKTTLAKTTNVCMG
jgi:hypothetical protein